MLESFHGEFTFIKFLSILAFFTTVGLFFCGIPICRQIWKRRDTAEISGAPFLMGVLGGTCWCVYGWLKKDQTVLYVTAAQIVLYSTYTVFYWFMTRKKFWISIKVAALVSVCASLVALVHFFGHKVFHPLGFICMALNTADFAAPLAGLRVVIRRGATSTLPLPLCIANFLVSSEWFLYGLLVWDFYLITPNGIGSLLAFAQLILFVVLPRKPMQRAPILRLFDCLRNCCCTDSSLDLESAAVVSAEKKDSAITIGSIQRMSSRMSNKHRWSSRVITNVVGDLENVIQKVHGDQFGYKLNKEDEGGSTDSGTLTPVEEKQPPTVLREAPPAADQQAEAPNAFEQSTRSIGARITELVTQRAGRVAASFGASNGSVSGMTTKEEDLEQLEGTEAHHHHHKGEDDGMSETNSDTDEEFVFPMTVKDVNQLLRLSNRLSGRRKMHKNKKKLKAGFGCSLQPGHFRALRRHHAAELAPSGQQPTAAGDPGLSRIEEMDAQQLDVVIDQLQKIKRAKSAPNIFNVSGKAEIGEVKVMA